jgi:hypothetical protein
MTMSCLVQQSDSKAGRQQASKQASKPASQGKGTTAPLSVRETLNQGAHTHPFLHSLKELLWSEAFLTL